MALLAGRVPLRVAAVLARGAVDKAVQSTLPVKRAAVPTQARWSWRPTVGAAFIAKVMVDANVNSIDRLPNVNPSSLGFDPYHSARQGKKRGDSDPANNPRQRFLETAHQLKVEIPKLMEPASISSELLDQNLVLVDRTIQLSVHGRAAHDLVLGAAAAGSKLALIDPKLNMLSYHPCVTTRRITVRWQIVGKPRVPLATVHHDRISTFDVDGAGRIVRHTIDRMSPQSPSNPLDDVLAQLLFPWQQAARTAPAAFKA